LRFVLNSAMIKKILKYSFLLFITVAIGIALFIAAVNYNLFGYLYTKEELKEFKNENASLIVSEDSKTLGKIFDENRTNITYSELPQDLINALIATEDIRFFEHDGVDSKSLLRVLFKTILLSKKSSGGGSTITQQLVKNMYGRKNFGFLTMPINKTKEAILAKRIENVYNKEEILALYLNTIPFGENVYGIEAAAGRYFNKNVEDLNLGESAILIGLLKANTYYNPRLYPEHSLRRRNVVLSQMAKNNFITQAVKDSTQQLPIKLDYANLAYEGVANYFLEYVKRESRTIVEDYNKKHGTSWNLKTDGLIITTTLNYRLQNHALEAFETHLKKMQNLLRRQYKSGNSKGDLDKMVKAALVKNKLTAKANNFSKSELFNWSDSKTDSISVADSLAYFITQLHAGLLAMNPQTGAIKAYVGGVDFRHFPYDQIRAKRQMASAFKPILYAAAFDIGFTPCTYLDNREVVFTDYDNWKPMNYDKTFGGEYSMKAALLKSKNVPTVDLYFKVGHENLDYLWEKMRFSEDLDNVPAVALGAESASIYEMAIAYSAFANGGFLVEPTSILSIKTADGETLYQNKLKPSTNRILKDSSAVFINAILQQAVQRGTGVALPKTFGITHSLAGKTGTSQNYSDAWFVSYNPALVMVTRVGASSPNIHFNTGTNGSGSRLALPLAGYTWHAAQNDSRLEKEVFEPFPALTEDFQEMMICEDFQESSKIEEILQSKKTTKKARTKKGEKSRNKNKKKDRFFKRLFKKK